jgi:hypothetical protein
LTTTAKTRGRITQGRSTTTVSPLVVMRPAAAVQ